MKIAILNEAFLKERHITRLKQLGDVIQYTDTNNEIDAVERLTGIDIAIADCWLTPLNEVVLSQAPTLKYVTLNSTGYDPVDLEAARRFDIAIANVPGFSTDSVAEHTIGLMLAVIRRIPIANAAMHHHPFQVDPDNAQSASKYLTTNIRDKVMGIVGLGQIGTRVAELAQGLGMKVVAYNRTPREIPGVTTVSFRELLEQSDVVSLNTALGEGLARVINAEALGHMKSSAYLVNTARGGLIDEAALASALQEGRIAGAALDVLTDHTDKNPLLGIDNVVLTPHIAYLTRESLDKMADIITSDVERFVQGEMPSVVN